MKVDNILQTIGNTPHVRINRLFGPGANVWVKSERSNPGGSIKDRIALAMVEDAEKSGALKPGGTIIEPTSGNTGIGLALVAAVKGYKLVLVMPDSMSIERRRLMLAYGAQFDLTPREKGMKGAIARAQELQAQTPRPAACYASEPAAPIQPDVFVREGMGGLWLVDLTSDTLPRRFPPFRPSLESPEMAACSDRGVGPFFRKRSVMSIWPGRPTAAPTGSGSSRARAVRDPAVSASRTVSSTTAPIQAGPASQPDGARTPTSRATGTPATIKRTARRVG